MNCPRCGGYIFIDKDEHGRFASCLQCGWNSDRGKNTLPLKKGGWHGSYQNQDMKSVAHQKGKAFYTLGRGIKKEELS